MCGIAVIFGESAASREGELSQMLGRLTSRGEVTERFQHPQVVTGTRRLKIVDRQGSKQPIFNAKGDTLVVFNGEIFNFPELRSQLQEKYSFTTEGDTETLLYAFEEYGEDCVHQFEGQFAFIIIDLGQQRLFAARDPLGIIPLYWLKSGDCLYFASTVKALTFLQQPIYGLSPGCFQWNDEPEVSYFQPQPQPHPSSLDSFLAKLKTTIKQAIHRRCQTDLPLGVIYSGGLDSSIVLSQAIQVHPQVTAFTIGCEGSEDLEMSQRFCRDKGIPQVVVSLKPQQFTRQSVREAIATSELTEYGDIINAAITLKLFEEIHHCGIKVVLGGDGSDELFGGYQMYQLKLSEEEQHRLFAYKLMNLHRTELQRLDRCSMAFSVEARVPFLAKPVVDLALATAASWKFRDGMEKWCLREAFRDELPDYILQRHKNPLSHSSGLHEGVRRYKFCFQREYQREKFQLHQPLRQDFSAILRQAADNVDVAIAATASFPDYRRRELILEWLKASLRLSLPQRRNVLRFRGLTAQKN